MTRRSDRSSPRHKRKRRLGRCREVASGSDGKPKDDFLIDGDVSAGYPGLDYRLQPNVLLGLAVAHSQGDMDYEALDVTKGDVDLALTSVLPYVHWSP